MSDTDCQTQKNKPAPATAGWATDEHGNKVPAQRIQPAPATRHGEQAVEWTPETVHELMMSQEDDWLAEKEVADAHNAALAAEREKVAGSAYAMGAQHQRREDELENQQLREQLAAERERLKEPAWIQVLALEKQLAAAVEALEARERVIEEVEKKLAEEWERKVGR